MRSLVERAVEERAVVSGSLLPVAVIVIAHDADEVHFATET